MTFLQSSVQFDRRPHAAFAAVKSCLLRNLESRLYEQGYRRARNGQSRQDRHPEYLRGYKVGQKRVKKP